MKTRFSLLALFTVWGIASADPCQLGDCTNNDCARAATGSADLPQSVKRDACSSFFSFTVQVASSTTTVTVTESPITSTVNTVTVFTVNTITQTSERIQRPPLVTPSPGAPTLTPTPGNKLNMVNNNTASNAQSASNAFATQTSKSKQTPASITQAPLLSTANAGLKSTASATAKTSPGLNHLVLRDVIDHATVTISPTAIPSFASACSGTSQYSSACSCFDVPSTLLIQTVALATATFTVTPAAVDITQTVVLASTTIVPDAISANGFACGSVIQTNAGCGCEYSITCNEEANSGVSLGNFTDGSELACADRCDTNDDCTYANYHFSTGQCDLRSGVPGVFTTDLGPNADVDVIGFIPGTCKTNLCNLSSSGVKGVATSTISQTSTTTASTSTTATTSTTVSTAPTSLPRLECGAILQSNAGCGCKYQVRCNERAVIGDSVAVIFVDSESACLDACDSHIPCNFANFNFENGACDLRAGQTTTTDLSPSDLEVDPNIDTFIFVPGPCANAPCAQFQSSFSLSAVTTPPTPQGPPPTQAAEATTLFATSVHFTDTFQTSISFDFTPAAQASTLFATSIHFTDTFQTSISFGFTLNTTFIESPAQTVASPTKHIGVPAQTSAAPITSTTAH